MGFHVLVPVDDSPPAKKAVEFALTEYPSAKITILHVVEIPDADTYRALTTDQPADIEKSQQRRYQEAQRTVASAEEIANTHAGELSTRIIAGVPADAIIGYTEDNDVDRIVIGLNKQTAIDRLLSASVTETIVQKAPVPVIVIK